MKINYESPKEVRVSQTYWVRVYMAGDIREAEIICQRYCSGVGLCVTLTETKYIYTGGRENGFIVELINYPRFPSKSEDILNESLTLSHRLAEGLGQKSYTVTTPHTTYYKSYLL
jgi:hypothetical protein